MQHKSIPWAVAALTVAAALAVQHRRHRRGLRAVRAEAVAERLIAARMRAACDEREERTRAAVERLLAEVRVVDAAAEVIDRAWAREREE